MREKSKKRGRRERRWKRTSERIRKRLCEKEMESKGKREIKGQ